MRPLKNEPSPSCSVSIQSYPLSSLQVTPDVLKKYQTIKMLCREL